MIPQTRMVSVKKVKSPISWLMVPTLLLMLLLQCAVRVDGQSMNDTDTLLKEKLKNYNRLLRPKYDQSKPLYISMAFDLIAIRDFDEVAEKFSVVGTVYSIWKDDRMVWDPEEYGDLYTTLVENGDFWTPTFIVVNAFEKFEKVGTDSYWPIRFYHSGDAVFHPGQVFTTTCEVDVELYPWDTQTCVLLFSVWGYGTEEIILIPYDNYTQVSLTYYGGNGEWDLTDTSAGGITANLFQFQFKIKRKPLFIVVNTLVPIILMSVLNILAFLIPISSGERISYCITVLLAVAVFLTLIGDTMPRSATTISVLSYYLVCVLALSMLIIVASVISMRMYHRGETERATTCWSAFVRFLRCRCRRKGRERYEKRAYTQPRSQTGSPNHSDYLLYRGNGTMESRNGFGQHRINTISKMTHESEKAMGLSDLLTEYPEANRKLPENWSEYPEANHQNGFNDDFRGESPRSGKKDDTHDMITWSDVSSTLDMVFFVFSVLCLAVFTGLFFIYTYVTSSKYDQPLV